MDINTCFTTTQDYHTIVYYTHLIPIFITLIIIIFALIKSKFSFLSRIFGGFAGAFCLWLVGSLVTWTSPDYNLVNLFWAPLDYISVVFHLLGAYFFAVLVKEKDLSVGYKLLFIAISIPAWWITVTSNSITSFYQPVCEAYNNDFLTNYKLYVEAFALAFILFISIFNFRSFGWNKKKQIITVASALILFFTLFSLSDYISSQNGIYEINLYSLFILPIFLFMIIYSMTNLQVFNLRLMGSQLLAYVMVIMVGSQFFFLQNATSQALTLVTFVLSLSFGVLLARNAKTEEKQRLKIEKLAEELQVANQGQSSLIHFMNHQIKGRFGNIKNIFAELNSEDYGVMPANTIPLLKKGLDEANIGVNYVQGILNGASAEKGTISYNMAPIDFKSIVENAHNKQQEHADKKGLKFELEVKEGDYTVNGDTLQLGETVRNLFDNSINYTPDGSVNAVLESIGNKIRLSIKDTGVGLTDDDKSKLFKAGGRGADSLKINVNATGYGLVFVKGVIEAHKGRVWAESEGRGKGSVFYLEIPKN
ncbi:MAG: HAMP domain-containing sensor histidine kinase [Patescibacteria group bacterium]